MARRPRETVAFFALVLPFAVDSNPTAMSGDADVELLALLLLLPLLLGAANIARAVCCGGARCVVGIAALRPPRRRRREAWNAGLEIALSSGCDLRWLDCALCSACAAYSWPTRL